MIRSTELPFLPGSSFNYNVGQTRFHKSQQLAMIGGEVPYLSERKLPGIGGAPSQGSVIDKFPSVYAKGEVTCLPSWVVYNKETLTFDAYYMENIYEGGLYKNYIIHKCKICFFLEDGTMQVFEKPEINSGLPQGCIMRRQKVRIPGREESGEFYDIIDLNVGREIKLFEKVFKITDCDIFTRRFLNRLGIPVPDPLETPQDPYLLHRRKEGLKKRQQKVKNKVMRGLLEMDNRILTFFGYWDDTANGMGSLHRLKILYYIIDDTIEIKDVTDADKTYTLVKRGKFSKDMETSLPEPGANEPLTLLNVLGPSVEKSRSVVDPLGIGVPQKDYYTDKDLTIGAVLASYGRRFVITDMDRFTKEFYKHKYGLEDILPLEVPKTKEELALEKAEGARPQTPPYNGFGSYEDTMINVKHLNPSDKVKVWKRDQSKEPFGYDKKILRFGAHLIENKQIAQGRKFIISYFLLDDTISVYEIPFVNSGRDGGNLIRRRKIYLPDQNLYSNKPLVEIGIGEFYLGNIVNLENFLFLLVDIDEYSISYMEQNPNMFPRSNIFWIMNKFREEVKSQFKEWAAPLIEDNGLITFERYRESVKNLLGNKISEHEILAMGRHFKVYPTMSSSNKQELRSIVHDEFRRSLYDDLSRLKESFLHLDSMRTGRVSTKEAYSILRGAKLPINADLLQAVLQLFVLEAEDGVDYNKLIDFFDYRKNRIPSADKSEFLGSFAKKTDQDHKLTYIDVMALIDQLDLQEENNKQIT